MKPNIKKTQEGAVTITSPGEKSLKEPARKIETYDPQGKINGFVLELGREDRFTSSYLSCIKPGAFKGFHYHKVREANYVCIKGKVKIILYTDQGREEHILDSKNPERLHIPAKIPTGLVNEEKSEAWIINNPMPFYDPQFKDEQLEFTEEQCENGFYKSQT